MNRKRRVLIHMMNHPGTPEQIFPLLCPVREYDWIQPWKCEIVYTDSGAAEPDCVFKTDFPDDGPEDAWVTSKYEPNRQIEFIRINALRSIRYAVTLFNNKDGTTQSEWKQVITGLNPEGDAFVDRLDESAFHEEMNLLERMLNHFISAGRMLKVSDGQAATGRSYNK